MSDIIRLLPDSIANQIAAGEVVQRPASVVKELLENAVDAGATQLTLLVKDAGKTLVQVVDNGSGMSETDARMSLERHATSKISRSDDLFALRTFGFRGEALASIAAVAQVELRTRRPEDAIGTRLQIEGSEVLAQEPVATPAGTSVAVKNLFFNVPARRNFLKSNPVELRHILDEFNRVALANPQLALHLQQNGTEVYNLKPGNLAQRIVGIFGKNYKEMLLPCQEEVSGLRVQGYVGKPEAARKLRGEQFFFANGRYIRHSYLHHAVMTAYENLLAEDTFPFYVLLIEIDPARIDVNVHPTKTEVKFDDERTVYAVVSAAVRRALGAHHLAPRIDFELDTNFALPGHLQPETPDQTVSPAEYETFQRYFQRKPPTEGWEQLYPEPRRQPGLFGGPPAELRLDSLVNTPADETPEPSAEPMPPEALPGPPGVFQVRRQYVASQIKSGLLLLDQQAAHERILYERYLHRLGSGEPVVQQELFPERLALRPADFALLQEIKPEVEALGFAFELDVPQHTLVLTGRPADLPTSFNASVVETLLEQFKENRDHLKLNHHESLAAALAKRTAIRAGTALSAPEMQALIDQLFACPHPHHTPDGRKTLTIINWDTLESLFG
ncbi:MAG: DNA mismatch repair endonuclease MutL [Bernardetiaceae bacterium]|jgi:DNA mismatch repair protein MutL|nr:DNA mismatch repair endonuclease MutL [Bernardetiaceae bacterium]